MFIIVTSKENQDIDQMKVKQNFNQQQNITSCSYNLSTCFPCYLMFLFIFTVQNILYV